MTSPHDSVPRSQRTRVWGDGPGHGSETLIAVAVGDRSVGIIVGNNLPLTREQLASLLTEVAAVFAPASGRA